MAQGEEVPRSSIYWRARGGPALTEIAETHAGQWLESDWGKKLPDLFEQVLFQQSGYALIMLWPEFAEEEEDYDPDENRTSKQRLAERARR